MDFNGMTMRTQIFAKCLIPEGYMGGKKSVPERIRTSDLRIRSPSLYPTELQARDGSSFYNIPGSM
jgi:hypothetical protein